MKKPPQPADQEPIGPEERDRLFAPLAGQRLALCVSGGADSMALMHLVADWLARGDGPSGDDGSAPVIVLTVDHGLRRASIDEARFVAAEAAKRGLPHETLPWEGEKPASGLQVAARDARRRLLFARVLDEANARGADGTLAGARPRTLVMAHHMDDQAETFLMRLARGSGIEGLSGMRAYDFVAPPDAWGLPTGMTVALARPLLEVARDRLRATLVARHAGWIEDPSNEDTRFERVRVRQALATLADVGVTREGIARSSRRLREACDLIGSEGPWLAVHPRPPGVAAGLAFDPCEGLVGVCRLGPLNPYLRLRVLRQMLLTFGGASPPPEMSEIEALADWAAGPDAPSSGGRTLGGCKVVVLAEGEMRVAVFREFGALLETAVALARGETLLWDGGRFAVRAAARAGSVRPLGRSGWAALKRHAPAITALGLLADAMAAAPAVFDDEGGFLACPPLERYIRRPSPLLGIPDNLAALQSAWEASDCAGEHGFSAALRPAAF